MKQKSLKHFSAAEYDRQFKEWRRTTWTKRKATIKPLSTPTLSKRVREELAKLKAMTAQEYELFRKWNELKEFGGKYTQERIDQTYSRIWVPSGYSDFRRLEPELIYIKEKIRTSKVDIWGNVSEQEWDIADPLAEDWDILRTLVSRHRNSGVIGKQHRYLVRDKGTKKYLGVICISVDMLEPANRDALIGWSKDQKLKTQPHCANGSTIVPLSPFAGAFNGGKLISLLCLSEEVAERWATDVGKDKKHYRLVHMMTTSLFGSGGKGTMYDSLEPYWINTLHTTSGETALELSPKLEASCKDWLLANEPQVFFNHFVAKKKDGSPRYRDPKDKALKKVFSLLGIKPTEYKSGHPRGMFFAPLYTNAHDFLRGEVAEAKLIKKFDNSVAALTKEWKFGLPKNNSGAKRRLERLLAQQRKAIDRGKSAVPLPTLSQPFWYRDMISMTWEETRLAFL